MAYVKKIKKVWDFFIIPIRAVDADTLEAFLDKGTKDWKVVYIRLALINADELKSPTGIQAKEYLENLLKGWMGTGDIKNDKQMYIISNSLDDYGRLIAMLYYDINDRDDPTKTINEASASKGKSINALMVQSGYAVYKRY